MSLRARVAALALLATAVSGLGARADDGAALPTPRQLRTVAGSTGEGAATALAISPGPLAHHDGTVYVAGAQVRAVDLATGELRVIAGGEHPRDVRRRGAASRLRIEQALDISVDADGRVYLLAKTAVAEAARLLRIDRDGSVSEVPAWPSQPPPGGLISESALTSPTLVAAASGGIVYVAHGYSTSQQSIVAVSPDGRARRVAGGGTATGCVTGPAALAALHTVGSLVTDNAGRPVFTSFGCVRRLEPDGTLTRLAGGAPGGGADDPGRGDGGPALLARVDPGDLARDGDDLYVIDSGRVRRVDAAGIITTVAGTGVERPSRYDQSPWSSAEAGDGLPAPLAPLAPRFLAASGGRVYVSEGVTARIRSVVGGVLGTLAGNGHQWSTGGDGGPAVDGQLFDARHVAVLPDGGFLVGSTRAHLVRRVSPDGALSTFAGTGWPGATGDGGAATEARIELPQSLAVGPDGSAYIAVDRAIRRVAPDGTISTFAGNGTHDPPVDGVPATQSSVHAAGIDVGPDGSVYIASTSDDAIRRVRSDGIIERVAGGNGERFDGDIGIALLAAFHDPLDVSVQPDGSFYVADWGNHRLRHVSAVGVVRTVAGRGEVTSPSPGEGDGDSATSAYLRYPSGVDVGVDGTVYVLANARVRAVRDGTITAVAGRPDDYPDTEADVVAATRYHLGAGDLAVLPGTGDLLLTEPSAGRVRLLTDDAVPAAPATATATSGRRQAHVSWEPPPDTEVSPVDSYTVRATPATGGPPVTRTVPGGERSTTVRFLAAGVEHEIEVWATNDAGDSPAARTTATPAAAAPVGQTTTAGPGGGAGELHPVRPTRLLDTRRGLGAPQRPVGRGRTLDLQVTGRGGVPRSDVLAVQLDITVVQPTASTYVTAYRPDLARPGTTSVHAAARENATAGVVVPVDRNGRVRLFNASGDAHLLADVTGWYGTSAGPAGLRMHAFAPQAAIDTRSGAPLGPGAIRSMSLPLTLVPHRPGSAVVLRVTVPSATKGTSLTVYRTGTPRPGTTALTVPAGGRLTSALVTVPTGVHPPESFEMHNASGQVHVVVHVVGWVDQGAAAADGRYRPLPTSTRLADTRNGTGVRPGPVVPGRPVSLPVAGRLGVPADASAALVTVTVTRARGSGTLSLHPEGTPGSGVQQLGYVPARNASSLVLVRLAGGRATIRAEGAATEVVVDVHGWYSGAGDYVPLAGDQGPGGIAVDPSSRLAYVSNRAMRRIEVLDLASGTLLTPIPVAGDPAGLDLSPDGRRLYAALFDARAVAVIDVGSRKEVARVSTITFRPTHLALAADGTAVIYAHAQHSTAHILLLDVRDLSMRWLFWPFLHGRGTLARSADRSVVGVGYSEAAPSDLHAYSAGTGELSAVAQHRERGTGAVSLSSDGTTIAAGGAVFDRVSGTVRELDRHPETCGMGPISADDEQLLRICRGFVLSTSLSDLSPGAAVPFTHALAPGWNRSHWPSPAVTPDGRWLLIPDSAGIARVPLA